MICKHMPMRLDAKIEEARQVTESEIKSEK